MLPLLAALVCVAANAFFVAAEFALAKVRPTALEALARRGDAKSRRAVRMLHHLDAYLSATQLGITLASLGLGWLGEPALAHLIEPSLRAMGASPAVVHGVALGIAFFVISLLHIVLGELVPKSLAISRPAQIARWSSAPLRIFHFAMWPFLWVLNGASRLVLKLLRLPSPQHAEGALSIEELRLLIAASHDHGAIDAPKKDLLDRGLRNAGLPVKAIMRPRVDMVVLSLLDPFERHVALVRQHGYTRYPVSTDGEPDHLVGYVHLKDILFAEEGRRDVRRLMRELLFLPTTTTVGQLIHELQLSHAPMAVVVDEHGGTAGLVTIEDAIEELVGEIQDEHDAEKEPVVTREDGSLLADASIPLADLPISSDDEAWPDEAEGHTVAGYVFQMLGRLPQVGDRVRLGVYDLVVEEVRHRRIRSVAVISRGARRSSAPGLRRGPVEAPT